MGAFEGLADFIADFKTLKQKVADLAVVVTPEAVHYVGDASDPLAPAFTNSWVNNDNGLTTPSTPRARSVGFYKWGGRVWLTGIPKTGASGSSTFTLPAGYRPPFDSGDTLTFASGGTALITPLTDGRVLASNVTGNVSTFVELFGLSFRHA